MLFPLLFVFEQHQGMRSAIGLTQGTGPPALHSPLGCTTQPVIGHGTQARAWSTCRWPPSMRVSSDKGRNTPWFFGTLLTMCSKIDISFPSQPWGTAPMPLSTPRLTSCAYHLLAQWTVYHHVPCFMNQNNTLYWILVNTKDKKFVNILLKWHFLIFNMNNCRWIILHSHKHNKTHNSVFKQINHMSSNWIH